MISSLISQQIVVFGERTLQAREKTLWVASRPKRTMDVVGSALLLVCTAPVLILAMAALKVFSGKAISAEPMGGRGCKLFTLYSLDLTGLSPRLLALKLFLLRWGIDRLPQFWNVLRGEMSLVGPEAAAPRDMERFRYEIPHYGARNFARPGMTGISQQAGWGGRRNVRKRAVMDARYVNQSSFAGDVKALRSTILPKRARR